MSRGPRPRRAVRYVALAALLLAAQGTTASAYTDPGVGQGPLDVVSSAQPSGLTPVVTDRASLVQRSWLRTLEAHAVATASATCDACSGTARTVQVLDAGAARRVRVDNVATAWSRCQHCGSGVVSVQVVLIHRATSLHADNRALALGAGCTACDTAAEAYQVVLSVHHWVDLYALRDQIVSWLNSTPTPTLSGTGAATKRSLATSPGSGSTGRLSGLERLATTRTGGRVVSGAADVRVPR